MPKFVHLAWVYRYFRISGENINFIDEVIVVSKALCLDEIREVGMQTRVNLSRLGELHAFKVFKHIVKKFLYQFLVDIRSIVVNYNCKYFIISTCTKHK